MRREEKTTRGRPMVIIARIGREREGLSFMREGDGMNWEKEEEREKRFVSSFRRLSLSNCDDQETESSFLFKSKSECKIR